MEEFVKKDFEKILKSAGLESRRWMKATDSNTSRVYDRNLEEVPVTIDLYGDWTRVVDYSLDGLADEIKNEILDIISRYLYVEKSKIVFVYRKKREGKEQHEKTEEECPVQVKENGLSFICELKKYADTGLFLDMEETRKLVSSLSLNQRVLNLFSYTSSFSVYAAQGGAESVVSVDLSNVYAAWSRKNLNLNGFLDESKYEVVASDALSYLNESIEKKRVFDLVIMDPPCFSNSHKADDFNVQKDYIKYFELIYKLLSDGGVLFFSENLQGFRFEKDKVKRFFDSEEITTSVFAPNFSHKRKSCRVWMLKKVSEKKRERIERKMSDDLLRLSFDSSEKVESKKRREKKSGARPFSFDNEKKESSNSDERRRNKRSVERDGDRYSRDDRNSRYNQRESRYRDREQSRDYRDDRYRGSRNEYSRDRRDSRYDDYDRSYSSSRYSRRDERDYRDDDRRESSRYRDRDNRSSFRSDYSSHRSDDDSRYPRRRDSYKRDTYPNKDSRRFHSDDERRRDDNSFRRDRADERRKKRTSPKPFGYDSFKENKNRAGATTRWLEDQVFIKDDNN